MHKILCMQLGMVVHVKGHFRSLPTGTGPCVVGQGKLPLGQGPYLHAEVDTKASAIDEEQEDDEDIEQEYSIPAAPGHHPPRRQELASVPPFLLAIPATQQEPFGGNYAS